MEGKGRGKGMRKLDGTLTVEAALIMAVTLFLIASLLRGAFEIHSQVAGNLVLQEAMEQAAHREEGTPEINSIEAEADRRLKMYYWCQNGSISLRDGRGRLEGRTGGSLDSEISIKKFNPEKFLRTVRAFGE